MGHGARLKMSLFGTSHGPAVGVVVDGIPRGTKVDGSAIQADLDRRKPTGRRLATKRAEPDRLVLDSGVANGLSTGDPIRAHVVNEDVDRSAYERTRWTPRPGHADYPALMRYGKGADLSGGGIFSGRMTVGLVIAGALARGILGPKGIDVLAFTRSIGTVQLDSTQGLTFDSVRDLSSRNELGCPDESAAARMEAAISAARKEGDSLGGVIECWARGVPVGVGEPFFDSVESEIAHLAFSIPAVKAIEFGDGFSASTRRGSEHNDAFFFEGDRVRTRTNNAGGILGGLATGEDIVFRVAVKPTSSIARMQETVDLKTRQSANIVVGGRHDPCIVPRAVVVVEAIARFAIADLLLRGEFR